MSWTAENSLKEFIYITLIIQVLMKKNLFLGKIRLIVLVKYFVR